MGLEFGLYRIPNPVYDSDGGMVVNGGSVDITKDMVWSIDANGHTVNEGGGGSRIRIIDGDITTGFIANNTSVQDDEWFIQGDFGTVVTVSRLFARYELEVFATGREGHVKLESSTDGSSWTTLQTGDTQSGIGVSTNEYDTGTLTFRYLRFIFHNGTAGSSQKVGVTVENVIMIKGRE